MTSCVEHIYPIRVISYFGTDVYPALVKIKVIFASVLF